MASWSRTPGGLVPNKGLERVSGETCASVRNTLLTCEREGVVQKAKRPGLGGLVPKAPRQRFEKAGGA